MAVPVSRWRWSAASFDEACADFARLPHFPGWAWRHSGGQRWLRKECILEGLDLDLTRRAAVTTTALAEPVVAGDDSLAAAEEAATAPAAVATLPSSVLARLDIVLHPTFEVPTLCFQLECATTGRRLTSADTDILFPEEERRNSLFPCMIVQMAHPLDVHDVVFMLQACDTESFMSLMSLEGATRPVTRLVSWWALVGPVLHQPVPPSAVAAQLSASPRVPQALS